MLQISSSDHWIECTYSEAILYCLFLDAEGFTDWRIPTIDEAVAGGLSIGQVWTQADNAFIQDDWVCTAIPVRYDTLTSA